MGMPDVDETEIAAGAKAITDTYGDVIGANQARNIAYHVLVAARGAKRDMRPARLAKIDRLRLNSY